MCPKKCNAIAIHAAGTPPALPEARNASILKLLKSPESPETGDSEIARVVETPYNIEWPFPACAMCNIDPWTAPWDLWNQDQQMEFLRFIFPGSASRIVNIVSDECMVKSQLNFYDIKGDEWQTHGFSSHVDWSRANNGGHPGSYTRKTVSYTHLTLPTKA